MMQLFRSALILGGALSLAAARPHAAPNPWTIVVGNGPYAGTYNAKASEVLCLNAKPQKFFAASFRDFEAKGPRALGDGGIKVDNPDVAGAKHGDLHVAFGDDKKRSIEYDVYNVPISFTAKGKVMELSGAGKTKDGVLLKITATCNDITTM
ncbi:MAG: hypothetical protein H0U66_15185 [Gemmatimonadaceae bacterium]|nr:hypothetical protein [Gemmatimonadaceae bacterium]